MRSKTNRHTEISISIESEKGRREWRRETKEIYERSQLYSTALWCIDTGPFSSRSYLNEIASNSLSYTIYIFYGSTSTCLFASSFSIFIDNERTITNTLWYFAHSVICLRFFLFPEGVFFCWHMHGSIKQHGVRKEGRRKVWSSHTPPPYVCIRSNTHERDNILIRFASLRIESCLTPHIISCLRRWSYLNSFTLLLLWLPLHT